jgi:TolB-like protein/DNA-binding winged helix-turn-helix (wHTH) protein
MNQQQERFTYEFGDFRIDPQRRVLVSRSGQPVQVTGKVFDTLLYLVEHVGELLDKRTLMEALWPQVVVEEANLTQTIHTLRRVLGERPGEHRYIVTVPGRGYRFVAGVTTREIEEELLATAPELHTLPVSARRRTIAAAALALLVLATAGLFLLLKPAPTAPQLSAATGQRTKSLAVLPFVDMSGEQDQAYFADGLSEEILNLLAQSSSMRIIARTSSFSFKDRHDLDIETIARKLNATHVLEGSVRKSGRRLRVTAQLVDATTSAHLWSQTYDRDLTDIFSVQDEIAAAVTDSLHAKLQDGKEVQRADTTSEQAFEQYLNGRYFFNRRGESDVLRARSYFEKALQMDPKYARAWAGLAGTYLSALDSGQPPDPQMQQAWLKAIEQALSLGPGIAEVHVRAAQYYWWLGEWRRSDEHCKLAIALNPSDALVLSVSASKALVVGHLREALALQRRAVAVDPLSAPGRESRKLSSGRRRTEGSRSRI